jgi:hypothetical protein
MIRVFAPRLSLFTAVLALMVGTLAADLRAQASWGIPLYVQNATPAVRIDAPVASGITVPRGSGIVDPNAVLELRDPFGATVPVQFKVLSRWGGKRDDASKEVKWVLVQFLADAPANGVAPYAIGLGTRAQGSLVVNESAAEIVVNTGPAQFVLDKTQFSLLHEVFVGGQNVLAHPGVLHLRDVWSNFVDPLQTELIVEDAGSVRTVLRQKGLLVGVGLQFTIRYTFWAGRRDVTLDFRLENDGSYGALSGMGANENHAYFSDCALGIKVGGPLQSYVTSETSYNNLSAYELRQDFTTPDSNTDMHSGFEYNEWGPNGLINSGNRFDGSMAVNAQGGAFCVSVDRFWQNFPKAFELGDSLVRTALWPTFGNGPRHFGQWGNLNSASVDPLAETHYRFEGGRWKTYRLTFDFRAPGQGFTPAEVADNATQLEKPLMAIMPLDWTARSFAFGQPIIERRNWNRTSHQRYEQMVQMLADDSAADPHPNWGQVGLPGFRARGGTYGGDQFYGWSNFGDVVWGDGFCSNHYDLPWGVLINYFRTGDYQFFDVGRDLAAHRRDYDQFHTADTGANKRGGQFYEKGWTHGNYQAPTPSHTWVHSLLLWYAMTGDEGAYEAALEVGDFIVRQNPQSWNGLYGARILGWQVEGLMHLWNYVGDSQYLQTAALAIGNWEQHEISQGANGFVKNYGWQSQPHAQSWMHAIVMSAIGKYYLQTLDPSVLPVMNRMANYFQNLVIASLPTGPEYYRTKGMVWERNDGVSSWDGSIHHKWAIIDAMSYGAISLHRGDLMSSARLMWESVTRYHQSSIGDTAPTDFTDPATFDRIGFKVAQYPGSESKVMSNMALWGQTFLAADALWDGVF